MALIHCNFYSHTLQLNTTVNVLLPESLPNRCRPLRDRRRGQLHPTLYLLHGLSDDASTWLRRTSVERYVEHYGVAVVMPDVHRSFYADMAYGNAYWSFVSEELPVAARSFFPLSPTRSDNFAAGLSMGGYGAFKLAFYKPDQFAAVASLSGALDIAAMAQRAPVDSGNLPLFLAFGTQMLKDTAHDLMAVMRAAAASAARLPRLYQCCGREDFLYEDNLRFRDLARRCNLDLTYREGPGSHDWNYWDRAIQDVLAWLPIAL